jgi:hypothetical protein
MQIHEYQWSIVQSQLSLDAEYILQLIGAIVQIEPGKSYAIVMSLNIYCLKVDTFALYSNICITHQLAQQTTIIHNN